LFEEFGNGFKVTMFRKVSNAQEKVSKGHEKVSNAQEKASNAFEKYIPLLEAARVTDTFILNIELVFERYERGVPFGQANVMEWLNCSKSKATNIMNVMKAANVIDKVTGFGPGKYEFVE
jgi:hypothetical protein